MRCPRHRIRIAERPRPLVPAEHAARPDPYPIHRMPVSARQANAGAAKPPRHAFATSARRLALVMPAFFKESIDENRY